MPVRRKRTRGRRRQQRRTQRGGRLLPLKDKAIVWPPLGGCAEGSKIIENYALQKGDIFDRFGPLSGKYVSPIGIAAEKLARALDGAQWAPTVGNTEPTVYSYTNRALPYAGVSDAGVARDALRQNLYRRSYEEDVKSGRQIDYGQFQVLEPVVGNACRAGAAFNTSGGALQLELTASVEDLLKRRKIELLPIKEIPPYFRRDGPIMVGGGAFKA